MKYLKTIFIITVLGLVPLFAVSAQDEVVFEKYDSSLGGSFSTISGMGLSYQRWYGQYGLQTAVGFLYTPEDEYYTEPSSASASEEYDLFVYNIGVGIQHRLTETSAREWLDGCLYLVAGITHFGSFTETYYYSETADGDGMHPYEGKSDVVFVPGISTGAGIGIEFVVFDHFSVPVELVLSGSWDTGSWLPFEAGLKVLGAIRYRY